MATFILYLVKIGRGLAEVAAMLVTAAEVHKLYRAWLENRQEKSRKFEVVSLEAAA